MDPASPNTPKNTMLDKVKSSFKQKANILDSDPPDNKAKSIVAGIIAPFIDIFYVDVRGSILWIPYTNLILQVAYFGLSLFGVIIFISGLLKTGMDLSDKITKSELLPMSTDGVKFPMMMGCFSKDIAQAGFSVGSLTEYSEGEEVEGNEYESYVFTDFVATTDDGYSETNSCPTDMDHPTIARKTQSDCVNGKEAIENFVEALGIEGESGFSTDYCYLLNLHGNYKPKYDGDSHLLFPMSQENSITGEPPIIPWAFLEHGKNEYKDMTTIYVGLQNTFSTIGVTIDEEVELEGRSWFPKDVSKGTKKETFSLNTAVMTLNYDDDGLPKVKEETDDYQADGRWSLFIFKMQTFLRRRTVIRDRSAVEIFESLGAALAASMFFMNAFFKDINDEKKVKVFRFSSYVPTKDVAGSGKV
jgi:hypothetical protein